ncbi:MAG: hypothetical protein ACTSR5_13035 [Promethearchaeota archaeon]
MTSTEEISKFNFQDYLKDEKSLTFLVGAGCSVLAPSNLPNARDFIKSIIESTIIKSIFGEFNSRTTIKDNLFYH